MDDQNTLFGSLFSEEGTNLDFHIQEQAMKRQKICNGEKVDKLSDPKPPSKIQVVGILQKLLQLSSICKADRMKRDRLHTLSSFISKLAEEIPFIFPRKSSRGYQFQKFHEMFHIPNDIWKFGMLQETGCSEGERLLKEDHIRIGKSISKNSNETAALSCMERQQEKLLTRLFDQNYSSQSFQEPTFLTFPNRSNVEVEITASSETLPATKWFYTKNGQDFIPHVSISKFIINYYQNCGSTSMEVSSSFQLNGKNVQSESLFGEGKVDFLQYYHTEGDQVKKTIGQFLFAFREKHMDFKHDNNSGWKIAVHKCTREKKRIQMSHFHTLEENVFSCSRTRKFSSSNCFFSNHRI